jgi:NAD(P)-dependent dehydrogenase (short-subunit alcohol dehydrogenase family)
MRHLSDINLIGGPASGLVCIITGPTSGIGKEAALELARRGAHIILACRSPSRGNALKEVIENEANLGGQPTPKLEVMELDLNSYQSVKSFAQAFNKKQLPLDILINNAGVFAMSASRTETSDGAESHMGTNHLAHFLLTLELLPALRMEKKNGAMRDQTDNNNSLTRSSMKSNTLAATITTRRRPRVVSVSSRTHLMGSFNKEDPFLSQPGSYSALKAYASSKLAQIAFSKELTKRTNGQVIAVALHPGEVLTDVVRSLPGPIQRLYKMVMPLLLLTPRQGARCTVHCATSGKVEEEVLNGGVCYYDSNCEAVAPLAAVEEDGDREWLWDWSWEQVGVGGISEYLKLAR